jgi:hypothetical protein
MEFRADRVLGNICIKCEDPFTLDHPRAEPTRRVLGTGILGLIVPGGGLPVEVGPIHKDQERCQATALSKGRPWS